MALDRDRPQPERRVIAEYLAAAKLAIDYGRAAFRDRRRTEADLEALELTRAAAFDVIRRLTPENYVSGPSPDDTDQSKEVWVFGVELAAGRARSEVYVKLRLVPGPRHEIPRMSVWSFHIAEHPMRYPLRPDRREGRREDTP